MNMIVAVQSYDLSLMGKFHMSSNNTLPVKALIKNITGNIGTMTWLYYTVALHVHSNSLGNCEGKFHL